MITQIARVVAFAPWNALQAAAVRQDRVKEVCASRASSVRCRKIQSRAHAHVVKVNQRHPRHRRLRAPADPVQKGVVTVLIFPTAKAKDVVMPRPWALTAQIATTALGDGSWAKAGLAHRVLAQRPVPVQLPSGRLAACPPPLQILPREPLVAAHPAAS